MKESGSGVSGEGKAKQHSALIPTEACIPMTQGKMSQIHLMTTMMMGKRSFFGLLPSTDALLFHGFSFSPRGCNRHRQAVHTHPKKMLCGGSVAAGLWSDLKQCATREREQSMEPVRSHLPATWG